MREIKFKLRDKDNKFLGYEYLKEGQWFYNFDGLTVWFQGFKFLNQVKYKDQFTGLKDKNGKEIYEGDIVKHSIYKSLAEIVYGLGSYMCRVNTKKGVRDYYILENARQDEFETDGKVDNFEIIGNIYENPDLLKGL